MAVAGKVGVAKNCKRGADGCGIECFRRSICYKGGRLHDEVRRMWAGHIPVSGGVFPRSFHSPGIARRGHQRLEPHRHWVAALDARSDLSRRTECNGAREERRTERFNDRAALGNRDLSQILVALHRERARVSGSGALKVNECARHRFESPRREQVSHRVPCFGGCVEHE